jgi:hypothetical protein
MIDWPEAIRRRNELERIKADERLKKITSKPLRKSIIRLAKHIEQICEAHKITIIYSPHRNDGSAQRYLRQIMISPVRSHLSYATALHELGHLLGSHQDPTLPSMVQEVDAWNWAKNNALMWTPAMHRDMMKALRSYQEQ